MQGVWNGRAMVAALAAALAALVLPATAGAGGDTINVIDDAFTPDVYSGNILNVGWSWSPDPTQHKHNVRDDSKLFYSGPPSKDGPGPGNYFKAPGLTGTFHYYCAVHGSPDGGMDGMLKGRPNASANAPLEPGFLVNWAEPFLEKGKYRFDVRFRKNGGKWKLWKQNTKKISGTFGEDDNPVPVGIGDEFKLQSRTKKASDLSKRSGWSPTETYAQEDP